MSKLAGDVMIADKATEVISLTLSPKQQSAVFEQVLYQSAKPFTFELNVFLSVFGSFSSSVYILNSRI